jgi:hypothetical protein
MIRRHAMLLVVVLLVHPTKARADAPPPSGIFSGTYICSQRQFGLQLTFEPRSASQLSAVVTFFTPGGDAAQPLGAFRADGAFESATGAFRLQPMSWIKPATTFMMFAFTGTYDAAAGRVKGAIQAPGCTGFEAARDEQASQRLAAETTAREAQFANAPTSLSQARGPAEQCLVIGKWYSRFKKEYPEMDILRSMADDLYSHALYLFMDEEFTPVFDTAFDKMTDPERRNLTLLIRDCASQLTDRGDLFMYQNSLGRPLRGTIFSADVVAQLAYRRTLRQQRQQLLKELPTLPATDASLERVMTLKDSELKTYAVLWPSEHRELSKAIEGAAARIATPVVESWVDKVIGGAAGYQGLAEVMAARSRLEASRVAPATGTDPRATPRVAAGARPVPTARPSSIVQSSGPPDTYLSLATADARARSESKLDAKALSLVRELIAHERAKISTFGAGLQALEAGTAWYGKVTTSFASFLSERAVQDALAAFEARRKQDLASAVDAVLAKVNQAQTASQIRAVTAAYFGVPSDRSDPAVASVLAAAETRERTLSTAAAHAEDEARSGVTFCRSVTAGDKPTGSREPSSRDLCMALASQFDAVNDTLGSRKAACLRGDYRTDPALALMCIQLCGASSNCEFSMGLTRFEKIACEKAQGRPGFVCDYVAGFSSSNAAAAQMLATIGASGSLTQGRFVETPNGWIKVGR